MQNKKPFEIILHVGRVTSLQSWVAKISCQGQTLVLFLTALPIVKACNSAYMQYHFKRFFVLHSSEVIFSFLIKQLRQKAIEIEIAFFHSLENPKGRTLDHFFMLHISVITSLPTDIYINELVEIFLKLSMKTVKVHLIIWTTLVMTAP